MKSVIARVWGPVSLALAVILVSCGPADCVSGPLCDGGTQTPTTLNLSATTVDFESFGATQQLTAAVLDQNGQAMNGAAVTWLTSNPGAATVSGGLVTSVGNGTATITAAAGAAIGTATVTVTQVPTGVSVTPADVLIESIDGRQALVAAVVDAEGSEVAGFTFTFSSDAESVATVDADGLVTAVSEGTAQITVEGVSGSETFSEDVTVTVDVPLTIATATLPDGVATVPYTPVQLVAEGGAAYTWSLATGSGPLPAGLVLSAGGEISGTPTTPGTYAVLVSVTSEGVDAEKSLSITIDDVPVLELGAASMTFVAGTGSTSAADQTLEVINGGESVLQWGVSSSESWLTLSPTSGATEGTGQVTVTADPTGLASGTYTATITATAPAPATGSPQTTTVTLTVAPLLGHSAALPDEGTFSANYLLGHRIVVTTATTLTHLGVDLRSAGTNYQMALYSDVDGNPGSLIASTASQAATVGVHETPVTPVALPAGVYWVMAIYETSVRVGTVDAGLSNVVKYMSLAYGTPLPATFPSPFQYSGGEFNYYILVADAQQSDAPLGTSTRIGRASMRGTSQTNPPGN